MAAGLSADGGERVGGQSAQFVPVDHQFTAQRVGVQSAVGRNHRDGLAKLLRGDAAQPPADFRADKVLGGNGCGVEAQLRTIYS